MNTFFNVLFKFFIFPAFLTTSILALIYSLQYFFWPNFLSYGQWIELGSAIFLSSIATLLTLQAKTFVKANKVLKFAIENPTLDPEGAEVAKVIQQSLLRNLGMCVLLSRFCNIIVWFIGFIFLIHAIVRFIF